MTSAIWDCLGIAENVMSEACLKGPVLALKLSIRVCFIFSSNSAYLFRYTKWPWRNKCSEESEQDRAMKTVVAVFGQPLGNALANLHPFQNPLILDPSFVWKSTEILDPATRSSASYSQAESQFHSQAIPAIISDFRFPKIQTTNRSDSESVRLKQWVLPTHWTWNVGNLNCREL